MSTPRELSNPITGDKVILRPKGEGLTQYLEDIVGVLKYFSQDCIVLEEKGQAKEQIYCANSFAVCEYKTEHAISKEKMLSIWRRNSLDSGYDTFGSAASVGQVFDVLLLAGYQLNGEQEETEEE